YSVALFDAQFADGEGAFAAALQQYRPRFVALYEDGFHFLVKMCLSRMREAAQCMSAMAREAGATVLAAGPGVSDHPERYFLHGVRSARLGEAAHTLRELIDPLTGRGAESPADVPGLALPDPLAPDGIYRTPRRSSERHPDVFPFPAWDLVDADRYRR